MAAMRTRRRPRTRAEEAVVARFVAGLGLSLSVDELERTVREVVEITIPIPDPADARAQFSLLEREALEAMGADFSALPVEMPDPVERTRLAYVALALDSLSASEVAEQLGRDVSRIRQRTRDRSLWSLPGASGTRFPRAQFAADGSEIPGMGAVLQALPPDLHPVAVLRWLTLPKLDLRLDGRAVSPCEWLLAGGAVVEAVALAEDLHVA